MNTYNILKILQEDIHTTIIATVDDQGNPYTCAVDIMLLEQDKLYFLTAKGKSFYQRLMKHPRIALTGLKGEDTMSSIAISMQGKVKNIGNEKLDMIFQKNSYMNDIYPSQQARDMLEVFEIYEYTGEYFDLSQNPILRKSFSFNTMLKKEGYTVGEGCNLKILKKC